MSNLWVKCRCILSALILKCNKFLPHIFLLVKLNSSLPAREPWLRIMMTHHIRTDKIIIKIRANVQPVSHNGAILSCLAIPIPSDVQPTKFHIHMCSSYFLPLNIHFWGQCCKTSCINKFHHVTRIMLYLAVWIMCVKDRWFAVAISIFKGYVQQKCARHNCQ